MSQEDEQPQAATPTPDIDGSAGRFGQFRATRLGRLLLGSSCSPTEYRISRWLFLRVVGLIHFCAFLSLRVQIDGLIGSRGILPAAGFLSAVKQQIGTPDCYIQVPTLMWLNPGDAFLHFLCMIGLIFSVLMVIGVLQPLCAIVMFAAYLSLLHVGQDFLSFQWDILLVEVCFLCIFVSPWRLIPRLGGEPAPNFLYPLMVRWLLFRLMVASGLCKLASGDPNWANLTALTYHFQTQPIASWISWHYHHLPVWWHKTACLLHFIVEIGLPFLLIAPRRLRHFAVCGMAVLQLLIIVTGNYGFFNLLALCLCISGVDDSIFPARIRNLFSTAPVPRQLPKYVSKLRTGFLAFIGIYLFVCSLIVTQTYFARFRLWPPLPQFIQAIASPARTFCLTNPYGLFATMTTTRPEIVIEGSMDGIEWKPYEFKWKTIDPATPPRFMPPGHMPRLDWQFWFASLAAIRGRTDHWLQPLALAMLQGRAEVMALFGNDPFDGKPPRMLRMTVYDYEFTTREQRRETGLWWNRKSLGTLTSRPLQLSQSPQAGTPSP